MPDTPVATYAEECAKVLCRVSAAPTAAQAESDPVYRDGIFQMARYRPLAPLKYRTPILIVSSFINRPHVLDMNPEISVVRKYLNAGFDVYIMDWGYPTAADQYLDLEDYFVFLDGCVRKLRQLLAVDNVNFHGYCLGGTLSAVYASLYRQPVRNMILQAAPIDFNQDNPLFVWARKLDMSGILDVYRGMPGSVLNAGFLLLDPINLILNKYQGVLNMDSPQSLSSFLTMDTWIFDSPALPAGVIRQYVKEWFLENSIIKGEFEAFGRRADLHNITAPVLVLAAELDHIVLKQAQEAILPLVASQDKQSMTMKKGHIGITTSRDSHREFWPSVINWFEKRSELLS